MCRGSGRGRTAVARRGGREWQALLTELSTVHATFTSPQQLIYSIIDGRSYRVSLKIKIANYVWSTTTRLYVHVHGVDFIGFYRRISTKKNTSYGNKVYHGLDRKCVIL